MKLTVCDRVGYRVTHREYTDEGFLRVPGRVARSGVQHYLASELELDGDPNRMVGVYRPPEEVFKPESLSTYASADVTDNHPNGLVDATNYRNVVRGVVDGPGRQDGDFVLCDLIIKDKAAIDVINGGKCELSAGYTAVYSPMKGVTEDGQVYEFIQSDIRINHVAVVQNARAGANARLFDHNPEKVTMTKIMLDSGRQVEVQDEATALLVTDAIDRLTAKVKEAEAKAEAAQAVADARAEELEKAKAATSDETIKARVAAIADCQAVARKIAGDSFACDSVDLLEIKRAALAKVRTSIDWDAKPEAYVSAAFDMEAEKKEEEEEEEEEDKKDSKDGAAYRDQIQRLSSDAAKQQAAEDAKPSPYAAHKNRLANAYKGA